MVEHQVSYLQSAGRDPVIPNLYRFGLEAGVWPLASLRSDQQSNQRGGDRAPTINWKVRNNEPFAENLPALPWLCTGESDPAP